MEEVDVQRMHNQRQQEREQFRTMQNGANRIEVRRQITITLRVRVELIWEYLFVAGTKIFPANQNVK